MLVYYSRHSAFALNLDTEFVSGFGYFAFVFYLGCLALFLVLGILHSFLPLDKRLLL